MARTLRILTAFVLAAAAFIPGETAWSQSLGRLKLDSAGDDDRKLLRQIDQMAADGQHDEAVGRLRRLMEQRGQTLVAVGQRGEELFGFQRHIPLREAANLRLAGWAGAHPEALALYRRRVDPLAERWYAEAESSRDEAMLRRLVHEMELSSFGDNALLRLGDLHLERGEFAAARRCWERLSPALRSAAVVQAQPAGVVGGPQWLVLRNVDWSTQGAEIAGRIAAASVSAASPGYPDTDIPLADIRARLVLASILEGDHDRAEVELQVFRQLHADAQGVLAGRSGVYAQLLSDLLAEARDWPEAQRSDAWLSLGGSQRRGEAAPASLDAASLPGAPTWRHSLPALAQQLPTSSSFAVDTTSTRPVLGYFPVVVGDVVYVNDNAHLWGWRLDDGLPLAPGSKPDDSLPISLPPTRDRSLVGRVYREGPPAFTMSSDGRRLVARMGPPPPASAPEKVTRLERGFLIGLDLRTLKPLFEAIFPAAGEGEFEGSPVLDERNLYVLMRKVEAGRAVSLYAACYDLRTGEPRWRRWVCGGSGEATLSATPPALLTLAGDTLYVNSNLGCVAALSTNDGSPRWVLEYPRETDAAAESPAPSPDPCVVHRGTVVAAPADSRSVLAIDAATGELIWQRPLPTGGAAQVLGVGAGNVIVGGEALRWIDVRDGRLRGQFPHEGPPEAGIARSRPRGYGRGLLVGDLVYWPTSDKIYVFRQRLREATGGARLPAVGEIDLSYRHVSGGNLAVSRGVLLLTTDDEVYAFAAPGRQAATAPGKTEAQHRTPAPKPASQTQN